LAWIRVTEKWSWKPNVGTTIVYKPGDYNVPRACATLAVAAGKAVRLAKGRKDDDGDDKTKCEN
jgi:hypothetical protein